MHRSSPNDLASRKTSDSPGLCGPGLQLETRSLRLQVGARGTLRETGDDHREDRDDERIHRNRERRPRLTNSPL